VAGTHSLSERLRAAAQAWVDVGRVEKLERRLAGLDEHLRAELTRIGEMLQLVYDDEPGNRRRLAALRTAPDYADPFEADEPLVSVPIATYDAHELLRTRALPSVLGQTYSNIEVVVVGDAAPPETARVVAEFGDPRVVFRNLTVRGPYPADERALWHVAGVPPRNAAVRMSRGLWIAPLDDDDEFRPDHIERLLERARETRSEVCYGRLHCVMRDGSAFDLGTAPPSYGHFGWQAAIFHGGLRFFEMELADGLFGSPADWSLCRRMLRAGVSFSMLDAIVVDHHESKFSPAAD
jgi:glycosyltransferase involved in cell wall biosynthesis